MLSQTIRLFCNIKVHTIQCNYLQSHKFYLNHSKFFENCAWKDVASSFLYHKLKMINMDLFEYGGDPN